METGARGRVLLIAPESARRGAGARALERAGYHLEATSKAQEALKLAAESSFDVIVCDQDLPDTRGLTLLRRLQEGEVTAGLVLLCARLNNEVTVQAAELGVMQVLEKPVSPALLTRAVDSGVTRSRHLLSALNVIMRPSTTPRSVSSTEAKNEFGSILDSAVHDGAVIITKHDAPRAMLVSVDRVAAALARHQPDLESLTREFDALVDRMRTPGGKAAARGLFSATPGQFGKAAVSAATRRRG